MPRFRKYGRRRGPAYQADTRPADSTPPTQAPDQPKPIEPAVRRISTWPTPPTLIWDETAYINYFWFLHHCGTSNQTEIACFARHVRVPNTAATFRVVELVTSPLRSLSAGFCSFEPEARALLPLRLAAKGIDPGTVTRMWCHTHPGTSVTPSTEDLDTFSYYYHPDRAHLYPYAFMVIMGTDGRIGAHMAYNASRSGECSDLDRGTAGVYGAVEMAVELPAISRIFRAEPTAALALLENHPIVVANKAAWSETFDRDIRPGIQTFRPSTNPWEGWSDRVIGRTTRPGAGPGDNWNDRDDWDTNRAFGYAFRGDTARSSVYDEYLAERRRRDTAEALERRQAADADRAVDTYETLTERDGVNRT
jgi:proteasome lid subunit RPN8/RPN11